MRKGTCTRSEIGCRSFSWSGVIRSLDFTLVNGFSAGGNVHLFCVCVRVCVCVCVPHFLTKVTHHPGGSRIGWRGLRFCWSQQVSDPQRLTIGGQGGGVICVQSRDGPRHRILWSNSTLKLAIPTKLTGRSCSNSPKYITSAKQTAEALHTVWAIMEWHKLCFRKSARKIPLFTFLPLHQTWNCRTSDKF